MSVCLYGDKTEVVGMIAKTPDEFEKTAHFLLVEFHKRAEQMGLVPVE